MSPKETKETTKEMQEQKAMQTEMTLRESEADQAWKDLLSKPIDRFASGLNLKEIFDGLGEGTPIVVTPKEMPHSHSWEKDGEVDSAMIMVVEYNGEDRTLYLSAISLQRSMGYWLQQMGEGVIGRDFSIRREFYDHKKFGKDTPSYNVNLIHGTISERDQEYVDGEIRDID